MTSPPDRDGTAGSGWTEQDRRILRDIASSVRLAAFALVFVALVLIAGLLRLVVG